MWIMNVLILPKDFFTSFVHILMLRYRNCKSYHEQKKKFVQIVAVGRALLDYNSFITE